jgi:hypothetical protein
MGGRGGSTAVNFSISNRRVQSTDVPVLAAYLPPTIYTSRLTRSLFFPSRDRSDPDHLFVSEKKKNAPNHLLYIIIITAIMMMEVFRLCWKVFGFLWFGFQCYV